MRKLKISLHLFFCAWSAHERKALFVNERMEWERALSQDRSI